MQLKKISTRDLPDWLFIRWPLQDLFSEYDSFCIMLNSNQKAVQAKKKKTKPNFNSILKQILNLDMQNKISRFRSMKSTSKSKKKKKSSTKPLDPCPYCTRPGQFEKKCYYKYLERKSKNFWQRFQTPIKKL